MVTLLVVLSVITGLASSNCYGAGPIVDEIVIGDGSGEIEPIPQESVIADIFVQASDTLSWDNVDAVVCDLEHESGFVPPGSGFPLYFAGPVDVNTARFFGGFNMSYHYPAGVYTVEATAFHGSEAGPPSQTTFHYGECVSGLGEGEYDAEVTYTLTDGEVDVSGGSVLNGGNVPVEIALSAAPFQDEGGQSHNFLMSFQTASGEWATLDETSRPWGTLPVLESSAAPIRVTIPGGTLSGIYETSLMIVSAGGDSSSEMSMAPLLAEGPLSDYALGGVVEMPITLNIVPEPATLGLMGLGLAALMRRRRSA
jgi:PEP-CTERM motif